MKGKGTLGGGQDYMGGTRTQQMDEGAGEGQRRLWVPGEHGGRTRIFRGLRIARGKRTFGKNKIWKDKDSSKGRG